MTEFVIPKPKLLSYGQLGIPFLSYDKFNNLVRDVRDELWASQKIKNFASDFGRSYNLWTVDCENFYRRNLFFEQVQSHVMVSIEIPHIDKKSSFPIRAVIYDENGTYFEQCQNIAVETKRGDKFRPTAWVRVPTIKQFVLTESDNFELDDGLPAGIPLVI